MKAAVLHVPKDIRLEEVEMPVAGPGDVVIKVERTGICPTDLRKYIGVSKVREQIILGHEFSGKIYDVGEGVSDLKRWDRVAVNPFLYCYKCRYCKLGRFNLCLNLGALGGAAKKGRKLSGSFAEYVKVPVGNVYVIGSGVPYEEVALTEPLAACLNGILMCDIKSGDKVVIIGAGPTGLMHLQLARLFGAAMVVVSDPLEHRRAKALELGADYAIDPKVEEPVAKVRGITSGVGADAVMVATGGRNEAICTEQSLRMVSKGGVVNIFAGTWPTTYVKLNPNLIHYNEVTLLGSYLFTPAVFSEAVGLVSSGKLRLREIVSDILSLDEVRRAFDIALGKGSFKVELKP